MSELFRLKIASKRQVTVPQRLLDLLQIGEGDEIRLEVEDGQIISVEACRVVPTRLFTPAILSLLAERKAEMLAGKAADVDARALVKDAIVADVTDEQVKKMKASWKRAGREFDFATDTAADRPVLKNN